MAGPVNNHNYTHHEHPTPSSVIEAARKVMGFIHLDPATTVEFNSTIKANHIFTRENDGFTVNWEGFKTIFLNPPGSQSFNGIRGPSCHEWLDKLYRTLRSPYSTVDHAIYIGYNGPETLSRRPGIVRCASAALWTSVEGTATKEEGFLKTSGRVQFASDRPYFPSLILYFGANTHEFVDNFSKFGSLINVI